VPKFLKVRFMTFRTIFSMELFNRIFLIFGLIFRHFFNLTMMTHFKTIKEYQITVLTDVEPIDTSIVLSISA